MHLFKRLSTYISGILNDFGCRNFFFGFFLAIFTCTVNLCVGTGLAWRTTYSRILTHAVGHIPQKSQFLDQSECLLLIFLQLDKLHFVYVNFILALAWPRSWVIISSVNASWAIYSVCKYTGIACKQKTIQ